MKILAPPLHGVKILRNSFEEAKASRLGHENPGTSIGFGYHYSLPSDLEWGCVLFTIPRLEGAAMLAGATPSGSTHAKVPQDPKINQS